MSSCPKGCVRVQGLGFTIVVLIVSIFTIFMAVSNCIAYGNIIRKDDPVIDKGWAIFLLVTNIILSIVGFVVFFVVIYKFFNSRSKFNSEKINAAKSFENFGNRINTFVTGRDYQAESMEQAQAQSMAQAQAQAQSMAQNKKLEDFYKTRGGFIPHQGMTFQDFANTYGSDMRYPILIDELKIDTKQALSCSDGNSIFKCPPKTETDRALNALYDAFN